LRNFECDNDEKEESDSMLVLMIGIIKISGSVVNANVTIQEIL
jgi:hypothetical protein